MQQISEESFLVLKCREQFINTSVNKSTPPLYAHTNVIVVSLGVNRASTPHYRRSHLQTVVPEARHPSQGENT